MPWTPEELDAWMRVLVRYQVGGETISALADEAGVSPEEMRQSLTDAATLLGLALRPDDDPDPRGG